MLKTNKIETLEDVREYVRTHYNAISTAWGDMLYDMRHGGEEYTVEDFIKAADMQIAQGRVFATDLF